MQYIQNNLSIEQTERRIRHIEQELDELRKLPKVIEYLQCLKDLDYQHQQLQEKCNHPMYEVISSVQSPKCPCQCRCIICGAECEMPYYEARAKINSMQLIGRLIHSFGSVREFYAIKPVETEISKEEYPKIYRHIEKSFKASTDSSEKQQKTINELFFREIVYHQNAQSSLKKAKTMTKVK